MVIVNFQDLQVIFGVKMVVFVVSFCVDVGEIFSLIGVLGCGKLMILCVLVGLQCEWCGSVDLFGQVIMLGVCFQGDLWCNVQMVFQDLYVLLYFNYILWCILVELLQIYGICDVVL